MQRGPFVLIPFLIVGGLGLVLLVISLVIGDVLDHFEIGDGLISGTALGIGLTVFGAAGALTVSAGLELVWAYVLAALLAVVAYVASVVFVRSLARSSDTSASRRTVSAWPPTLSPRTTSSRSAPNGSRPRTHSVNGELTSTKAEAGHSTNWVKL